MHEGLVNFEPIQGATGFLKEIKVPPWFAGPPKES